MQDHKPNQYDVIIVGGGIAGLTAAAYLAKEKHHILLVEKQEKCGGLVNTFQHNGFTFEGGVRAIEDSGVLFPMLRDLGIELDLVKNTISLGVEDQVIQIQSEADVDQYQDFLISLYPESETDIKAIIREIRKIMTYMDIQYGIDNPVFMDLRDRDYLMNTVMPWALRFFTTVPKINQIKGPVNEYLQQFTRNQSLLDIISQHFFQETPAFFALSYLKIYLDYYYPKGGTAKLVDALMEIINETGCEVKTNTTITQINPQHRTLSDQEGNEYAYRKLVWAADQKTLYDRVDVDGLETNRLRQVVSQRRKTLKKLRGNDSVLTVWLETDLAPQYFKDIATEHFFYTPDKIGQSQAGSIPLGEDREIVENWLKQYLSFTTYEISIPVLRDASMAPAGKTGLIVSVLFDYSFAKQVEAQGWYAEMKDFVAQKMIATLDDSIYPGLRESVSHFFVSTPLTMARMFGNHQGAITGWSFTNEWMPAEDRMLHIANSVKTKLPDVYQAGQWTYSPSGLPISILTGKMAADAVSKKLKR